MATHITAKIPYSRVIKIAMWHNSAKETMNTIYTKLQNLYPNKLIYIQNAGFFSMTDYVPCWGLKSNGNMVSNVWNETCYMAMNGNKILFNDGLTAFPSNYTDGVSGYPALIENGKKSSHFHNGPDGYSDRGRTMIGYNDNYIIMSCIADTSGSSDFTLAEELNYMLNQGCTYAMNLDGGGSSQCNFNGSKITSTRRVSNFVYMVVEPEKQQTTTTNTGSVSLSSLKIGDTITLVSGAKYTSGKSIPNWVIKSKLYCRNVYTNGVITFSTVKTGPITGNVNIKYIQGYTGNTTSSSTSGSTAYKVKVINCTKLNIRQKATTASSIIGSLTNGTIVEIVSKSGTWGQLSSSGWISLNYTTKVS